MLEDQYLVAEFLVGFELLEYKQILDRDENRNVIYHVPETGQILKNFIYVYVLEPHVPKM